MPYGSSHTAGISSIVWGVATPGATLAFTLSHPSAPVVTRTAVADLNGNFAVSVDRLIADGDSVQVSTGTISRTVQVPVLQFHADAATKIITGTAPADITTTALGAPHSLAILFGANSRQLTTTASGAFSADFQANPFQPSALGTLRYTTPNGDHIYKPLFVADPLQRGVVGDEWADVILGQPDFSQITFNEVVGNRLFNPLGVYIDRSAQPNRVYIYDSGNSRMLGMSHLGAVQSGQYAGQPCTSNSDYPGSVCTIDEHRAADLVLGQPSFTSSTCNGDSAFQSYPDVPMATAATLCGLREEQMSVSEGSSAATMTTDAQGNLYVPDFFNNRVLRYNNPFATDTIADGVWGQADFSGVTCNRGATYDRTSANSLCLSSPPGFGDIKAGVAIDSLGNLWVADTQNNRVLRFPFNATLGMPAPQADLVLGQQNFESTGAGSNMDQMNKPASVRVNSQGIVYVADDLNNRILVFAGPLTTGMSAQRLLGSGWQYPAGLEIDATGAVWVSDVEHGRIVRFVNEVAQTSVDTAGETRAWGGLGVDRDGNVMIAGWDKQAALHYAPPNYTLDAQTFRPPQEGLFNQTSARGLFGGKGLEVTANQLIYGDSSRILFWNDPQNLTTYQPADGVIGAADFQTRDRNGPFFERMRADATGHLWVLNGTTSDANRIYGYHLPLATGAQPQFTITNPLPIQGGGLFTWTSSLFLGGIEVQPSCDCLWLADEENHRVFRIRNVSTQPVVDVIIGQQNSTAVGCNQGRGLAAPSRDSLCHPGALAFDRSGNLYIADHNTEFDGNLRLLEYDASTLPTTPSTAVFDIPATRVFGRNGSFTAASCPPFAQDPMCGPWEPAFDSHGRMIIGFNAYLGPRFALVYQDPLTNPMPIAALGDFQSMPTSARFDQFDNLYVLDHNRSRILIYKNHETPTSYSISGTITLPNGTPVAGVQVSLTGSSAIGTTNAAGVYTLSGLSAGTYTLVPSKASYTFSPTQRTVTLSGALGGQDFVASQPSPSYSISGTITTANGTPVVGVQVLLTGSSAIGTTNAAGVYTISGLSAGTYTLVPSKASYTFSPTQRTVTLSGSLGGQDFVAIPMALKVFLPLSRR